MAKKGGKRPGAGRPKGSSHKPKLLDNMTPEEIREVTVLYIKKAKENPKVLVHLIDQIYGKARQSVGLDGGEEDKPIAILSNVFSNNSNEQDSQSKEKD